MKRYILKVIAGVGEPDEMELDHWNETIFERYQNNELSQKESSEIVTLAHDLVGFECWIEEIEDNLQKDD